MLLQHEMKTFTIEIYRTRTPHIKKAFHINQYSTKLLNHLQKRKKNQFVNTTSLLIFLLKKLMKMERQIMRMPTGKVCITDD